MYFKTISQQSPSNLTEVQNMMVIKSKVIPGIRKWAAFGAVSIFSCTQNANKQVHGSHGFNVQEHAENLGKITSKPFCESVCVGGHDPGHWWSQLQELTWLLAGTLFQKAV